MNINEFMKRLRRSQAELEARQAKLDSKQFVVEKQGIVIKAFGSKEIESISIDKELVDPEDVEQLEILLVAAFKELFEQIDKESKAIEEELGQGLPF